MSVRVVELDLAAGGSAPAVPARYRDVRVLVRLHGVPLGFVDVPNEPPGLAWPELERAALTKLGRRIRTELAGRRLAAPGRQAPAGAELPVAVVVCTRNGPHQLAGCLAALGAQRHPSYEVLVVDCAPEDREARRVAESQAARYVFEPRPGLSWARNRGLAESCAPIVAFTDDDARPDPGWLAAIAAGFAAAEVSAVTGLVGPAELETRAQLLFEDAYGGMKKGFEPRLYAGRACASRYRPERYGAGCNMAFRREALERLGGFDTALDVGTPTGGGGDIDLFQRLIEEGSAIVYRPDALVRHLHRRSNAALRRQLFDNGRGYSSALTASFLRARGVDRVRVVAAYWSWVARWHLARIARRLARRERLPLRLLLAELAGAPLGPVLYWRARRAARALAALDPTQGR